MYKDQDSQPTNNLYKQDQGINQYYQDRDWEEQKELLSDRFFFKKKSISDLFDIDPTEITQSLLNDLAEANLDRILSYEIALRELKNDDGDLKLLFSLLIGDSYQYIAELDKTIATTGQNIVSGSNNTGKICRRWMDLRAALAINRRKAVLAGCEFSEEAIQKAYTAALDEHAVPAAIRDLALEQKVSLEMSYRKIKELRNAQVLKKNAIKVALRTSA